LQGFVERCQGCGAIIGLFLEEVGIVEGANRRGYRDS
jgi:hypothetical protein